jgi:signal transduction histidine kinase/ActR/RegA family two-component response regulator
MLTQIEIRDIKLADHQRYLEEKVLNRTRLLQETVDNLEQAKRDADSANQAKSQFLANMTHELRTPLIGVLGMNELLARTELSEQQRSLVATVQSSGENLLALISDILDFSKIDAGFLRLDNVEVDLYRVVEETTHLLAERAVAKTLDLSCQVTPEAMWKVRTDPGRYRQILLNLIGNALKFTETGSVAVQLDMRMSGSALGHFVLTVADSGIGISEQEQAKIFSPFVQSDNTSTRRHGGTGLGLAIVRQLVAMMDGKIRLDSREGEGSVFTVELPLPLVSKQIPRLPATLRGRRVLLYHRSANTQCSIRVMLSGLGLQAVEAASPEDVWHRLLLEQRQEFPFDYAIIPSGAVLLDGSLLAEKLKNEPLLASLRIIVTNYRFTAGIELSDRSLAFLELPATWSNLTTCLVRQWQRIELISGQEKHISKKEPVRGVAETHSTSLQHRVLLADDNAVTRELICLSLARHPLTIDIAVNGVEALEMLEAAAYDLVLMDCNMPELDGIEATRRLRQRGCMVPVIALTAHVDQRVYENFVSAGVNDSLRKPFRQSELFSVIGKWLDCHAGLPAAASVELPNATEGEG